MYVCVYMSMQMYSFIHSKEYIHTYTYNTHVYTYIYMYIYTHVRFIANKEIYKGTYKVEMSWPRLALRSRYPTV